MTPTKALSDSLTVPLRLRYATGAPLPAAAWFIAGGVEAWLSEVVRWELPLTAVRLLVLPGGGALAMVEGDASPRVTPQSQPYACAGGQLYFPAEAELHPPVSDREIAGWLGQEIAVMHPSLGVVRSPREALPTMLDFCRLDAPQPSRWSDAVPGIYAESHIRRVEPLEPPGGEALMELLREDIGTEPADELPPLPEEQAANRLIARAKLKGLQWLGGVLPAESSPADGKKPGKAQQLANWVASRKNQLEADLSRARHKELARLMEELEKNPDSGLRFALPLTGDNAGRGIAPPTGRLAPRNTDFSLGRIRQSRPTDFWDTPEDARRQLRAKYHELATRELNLQRFRRAAYIYAELLGDYSAAANALMQGRFWREAATLYTEKLRNLKSAAECLEKGGLLLEAITLYEQLKEHEKCGELFRLMGRDEEANAAFDTAVNKYILLGDRLSAAKLLEVKMDRPERALAVLEDGWPSSNQAAGCLRASFMLLGRLTRHEPALQRVRAFRASSPDKDLAETVADVLAGVATGYPDSTVRHAAADTTRVLAGHRLVAGAGAIESRKLLQSVQSLAIEDRLLARDIARYQTKAAAPAAPSVRRVNVATPIALRPDSRPVKSVEVVDSSNLSTQVNWERAVAVPGGIVSLGITEGGRLRLERMSWEGNCKYWRLAARIGSSGQFHYRLVAAPDLAIIGKIGKSEEATKMRSLPSQFGFPEMAFGWPAYLPNDVVIGWAIAGSMIWTASVNIVNTLTVKAFHSGNQLHSRDIQIDSSGDQSSCWLIANGQAAYLSIGRQIIPVHPGSDPGSAIELASPVTGLTQSPANTALRIIATHAEGASIVWPTKNTVVPFATGLIDPVAYLGREGLLVAIGRNGGRVYRLEGTAISSPTHFEIDSSLPIALLPAEQPDTVAAIHADGIVKLIHCKS